MAGCGSVDQSNQETEKLIEEETDSTVTNSEEAEITEESDQNKEADSNGSEATNTTGPITLEEYLTERTWLYRQDWLVINYSMPWKRIYVTSGDLLLCRLKLSEAYLSGITVWRSILLEISLLFFFVVIYCQLYFTIVLYKVHFEMAVLFGTA